MMYLEKESSALYFNLSRFFYHEGKLSWDHYLDRMLALKKMCEPTDPVYQRAHRILLVEDFSDDEFWPEDNDSPDNSSSVSVSDETDETDEVHGVHPGISRDENGDIHFLSRRKGLKDWVFHQYDVDFHPSIPHGHYQGNNNPKLDSYLGYIYKGSKQINRIERSKIIELWNDEEFRHFSKMAIDWYIDKFPKYNWRVVDPTILPRRR